MVTIIGSNFPYVNARLTYKENKKESQFLGKTTEERSPDRVGMMGWQSELFPVGWGTHKPELTQNVSLKILPNLYHNKAFDYGGYLSNTQMMTQGDHAGALDKWLGIPYDSIQHLPLRDQRQIIKDFAKKNLKKKMSMTLFDNSALPNTMTPQIKEHIKSMSLLKSNASDLSTNMTKI